MRLTLFLATFLVAAVLAPVGIAEDSPPATGGVTAGAERAADEKPKRDNHGSKVRACAKQQKTDKKTAGGHGKRMRECAKKAQDARAEKKAQREERKARAEERREQCKAAREELGAAMDELKADFRARFEELKGLPRAEAAAAMRELKAEFEQAMQELRDEFASEHEECKGMKERAEEQGREGKARA